MNSSNLCRSAALRRALRSVVSPLGLIAGLSLIALPALAQTSSPTDRSSESLKQIDVTAPKRKPPKRRAASGAQPAPVPAPNPSTPAGANTTPLNTNVVAGSASRLGLPVRETPATIEVIDRQTMQDQGYRTTTEAAQGAAGVLSGDAAGAPGGFSMRGFKFGEVNILYNGISTGPQSITSRVMDTSNLEQVEFLKGPSSLMSGLNAIGGSVNYVNRQPTSGPIRNELDLSFDSFGTARSHLGSGGSTAIPNLDYRFDLSQSRLNSFIDGDYQNLTNISTQFNYRVNNAFKAFVAVEYKKDAGHVYWGTPMVPLSFAGPYAKNGVVSGNAISTFDGSVLGPLTVDSRTLKTNYNVADNSDGVRELWLRTGFDWTLAPSVTVKNQAYHCQAARHYFDAETYAFNNATSTIDRDRFAVTHYQHVYGDNTDLVWDSRLFGMENRLASQLQVSRNEITFEQHAGGFPEDTVAVVNPSPGVYGPIAFDTRNSRLDTIALSFEDRLKLTPAFALIGGVRLEDLTLARDGINADGTIPDGQPFTKTWKPISYRAAYTWEPIRKLTFYSMVATAYDPAAAGIFSISPANSLQLTSARIYETGVKQLFWNDQAEWTLSAYDVLRKNVYVQTTATTFSLAGLVQTKGVELAGGTPG